jgi:predicted metalloprotease with PDZ domain
VALCAAAGVADVAAQAPADTLIYNVAVTEAGPHLSVEARFIVAAGTSIFLDAPPAGAGTSVTAFGASDDRGLPLRTQRTGGGWVIARRGPGAVRFRYQLAFTDSVSSGSTASGLDTTRLYAVTRSLFVAPDPVLYRKLGQPYPLVRLAFLLPAGWRLVANWDSVGPVLAPRSGDDLLEGTVAAAPDYRLYDGSAGGTAYTVAVRGSRAFTDSALVDLVSAGLRLGAATLGPVPVPRVTYISDTGRKGRTSGSLQGTASIGLLWEPGEMLERSRSHDTFHETLHLWFGGAMEAERWWTEGVTDYLAARLYAAWRGDQRELAALCYESLRNYARIPHRLTMTMAAEARSLPGGDNTIRLVYRKGMLAGLLLDAAVRRGSHAGATLDDVARRLLATARTRRSKTIAEAEIGDAVAEEGGSTASREWARVVTGTEEITEAQVAAALRTVTGVDLPPPPPRSTNPKALSKPPSP